VATTMRGRLADTLRGVAEPFSSPSGLVFTSSAVMFEGLPILLVSHDADDQAWQFVNGHGDTDDGMKPILVHAHHLVELDESVAQLADLPLGWRAWRPDPDAEWLREPQPSDCGSD
jgi:hypothetical protein